MMSLPREGQVLFSVQDAHKKESGKIARLLASCGLGLVATPGPAAYLRELGLEVKEVQKIGKGRPNVLDVITNQEVQLVINSPTGEEARSDEIRIRRNSILKNIPCITTMSGARAAARAIESLGKQELDVTSLQEFCSLA
jgi:carbamoyl-phosphate synthase large subunit